MAIRSPLNVTYLLWAAGIVGLLVTLLLGALVVLELFALNPFA